VSTDQTADAAFRHDALAVVLQVREPHPPIVRDGPQVLGGAEPAVRHGLSEGGAGAGAEPGARRSLQILLWQRSQEPFAGSWSLPGGPLGHDERLGASISRQLATKVDIRHIGHLEQVETRSDPDRDPTGRVLATVYLGLVPLGHDPALPPDTAWHPARRLPSMMAYDHTSMTESALARLRAKLSYTNICFALAPPTFTLSELREVYVAALGHDVSVTNLQRVLLRRRIIEPTGETTRSGTSGGRPAATYRFCLDHLQITDTFAVLRPPVEAVTAHEAAAQG
jgi:8-oxo-dGTP diphosphatase